MNLCNNSTLCGVFFYSFLPYLVLFRPPVSLSWRSINQTWDNYSIFCLFSHKKGKNASFLRNLSSRRHHESLLAVFCHNFGSTRRRLLLAVIFTTFIGIIATFLAEILFLKIHLQRSRCLIIQREDTLSPIFFSLN